MSYSLRKTGNGKFEIFRRDNLELFVGPVDEKRDESGKWTNGGNNPKADISENTYNEKEIQSKPQAFTEPGDEFPESEELENIDKFGNQFEGRINKTQKEALRIYSTNDGNRAINTALREGKTNEYVSRIDLAISSTKIDRDVMTYRGVDSNFFHAKIPEGEKAVGYSLTDKAFTSTSLVSNVAESFNGSHIGVMRIRVPKGTNAAYIGHRGEYELLLGRNSSFKITGYSNKQSTYDVIHIYDAELV